MAYTITQQVHVTTILDGVSVDFDLAVGDEAPEAIAELLVAQGCAKPTEIPAKKAGKSDPTPVETEA